MRATERIEADESLLNQHLENVFRNAIENAGEDATVVVGPLADGTGFFVADDGPGIPGYRRAEVFDAGYTTNQDEGGTGLGLAIVERIVEAHGWDGDLTASEDDGARFEFSGVTSAE